MLKSIGTPKSVAQLSKGQAFSEEQKIAKMMKKLETLETKQREWTETEQKNTAVERSPDEFDETVKANASNVALTMFSGRLPNRVQSKRPGQSLTKGSAPTTSGSSHDERMENAKALITAEDIKRIYLSEGWEGLTEVRVKLIVTAISLHNPPGALKDKFVRFMGIAKLGVVHTAVQIGPIILEWNDASILLPCPTLEWASSKVLLALDMRTLSLEKFFKSYIDPVSEVIATWNGTYMYNEYTNNCQLFTEEVLKAMEIENVFTGKVKKFLDSISTADTRELVFKHKFDNDPREYEFRSHEELDTLCHEKTTQLMANHDGEDYRLLKAYDRVFWLRYHGVEVSENLAKDRDLQNELLRKFKAASPCFFGDPTGNTRYAKTPMKRELDESTLQELQYR